MNKGQELHEIAIKSKPVLEAAFNKIFNECINFAKQGKFSHDFYKMPFDETRVDIKTMIEYLKDNGISADYNNFHGYFRISWDDRSLFGKKKRGVG